MRGEARRRAALPPLTPRVLGLGPAVAAPPRASAAAAARAPGRGRGGGAARRECVGGAAVGEEVGDGGGSSSSSASAVDFDDLGFGCEHVGRTRMFVAKHNPLGWSGDLRPYGPLEFDPAAQVLNYGQSIFEGMKAQRTPTGDIVLFRPDQNALRMMDGALRMAMPQVPENFFVKAVVETVQANAHLVPPHGKGSLYVRPLLLGSGAILGLGPAPEYTFLVYVAPVGAYFKGGQLDPIDLVVEQTFHRAAPGGTGGTKAAGNYSPVLPAQLRAKAEGFADVIYLDAVSNLYLEEVSSCNIFVVKGNRISTPPLTGTILPGITRKSVIELARSRGYEVHEEPVSIDAAMDADEMFTCGTAVVLCPVGSITYGGAKKQYGAPGEPTPVALELYQALTDLQLQKSADPFGWVYPVEGV